MAGDLYDQDFIGWTEQQARLLRAAAEQGVNLPLDWVHLAEEIEDLGRNHAHAVKSLLARIVEHLLKLQYSPAAGPRDGWIDSIDDARSEIELYLQEDPGLRLRLPDLLKRAAPTGTKRAATALARHAERDAAVLVRLAGPAHYTLDQVLDEDWLPARPDMPALTRA